MFKKIIIPNEEIQYRQDSIDNKYLINEGNRALGIFAAAAGTVVPTQILPQDVCFYILEGKMDINTDDKTFCMKQGDLLLIPKTSAFNLNFIENAKVLTVRF